MNCELVRCMYNENGRCIYDDDCVDDAAYTN